MFYDVMGPLLTRAATSLMEQVGQEIEDEFLYRELEAIALFLGELGAMWSQLFPAILEEQQIYADVLQLEKPLSGDPLANLRELSNEISRQLTELVSTTDSEGLQQRARLRAALLRGADIQKDMLSEARKHSPVQPRRRV